MVTTLYLIRHGETEGAGQKRYHGSIDVPLSENGIRQMQASAAFVRSHVGTAAETRQSSYLRDLQRSETVRERHTQAGLTAVYCSDLRRSIKSAEILAGILAGPPVLRPVIVPALRERSFGIWEGMTFAEIREAHPLEFEAWADNPLRFSPPGGESTSAVQERVIPAFEKILAGHYGETIAVVAHGGVNRIILCKVLGIPAENIFRIEQNHAAVNVIEFWDRYPVVKLLNGLVS